MLGVDFQCGKLQDYSLSSSGLHPGMILVVVAGLTPLRIVPACPHVDIFPLTILSSQFVIGENKGIWIVIHNFVASVLVCSELK